MNAALHVALVATLCAAAASACTRGASEERLRTDLQGKLNRDVQAGLFEVVGLRREGSAPVAPGDSGAPRVVVYFNTTLRLGKDYAFGGWDQLGASSIAFALGATEKGIFGLKPENKAGDLVRAYGSAIYEQTDAGWVAGAAGPSPVAKAPDIEGSAPPSRSKQLIDKLASMVDLPPPGVPPQQDDIIAEELTRASENIERRVKRREHTFTVATGPELGEYARFGTALIAAVNEVAPNVKLRQRPSEGSIENVWLLSRTEADYAIVQNDVATAAFNGEDVFARGGAVKTLRAVGGLFAEPIHIVVAHASAIRGIGQLRGKRVAIGTRSSGTRFNAMLVLEAHDLTPADLGEVGEDPPEQALARLQRGEIDAVFVSGAAPIRELQQLAVGSGFRLLSIDEGALNRLLAKQPGLARITLPPNTYPRQRDAVVTAAATALLLTTVDTPSAEVERVSDLIFTRMPRLRPVSADPVRASAENEYRGITIPLHSGASRQAR